MQEETIFPSQAQEEQPGKEYLMDPAPEVIKSTYKAAGKLEGKVALITGGDSGIGKAIAVHYAREGADVAIVYKPEEHQDAHNTRLMIEEAGGRCFLLAGDLRAPEFCTYIVEKTVQEFGGLNIVVNNAAEQYKEQSLEDIPDEQLESIFQTNIISEFRICRAALKYLDEGDTIINTTSVNAYKGNQQLIDYTSTKGAILAFTRSLALNLASKGIRVNGVAPGPIWTPLIPATMGEDDVKQFGMQTPLQRAGQPSEVAPCYVFLASDDSSYITGQVLHPNGGMIVNS